ncbi:hypothetical protein D3C85_592110 [compost metagenome]|jgi:hypothetical protein
MILVEGELKRHLDTQLGRTTMIKRSRNCFKRGLVAVQSAQTCRVRHPSDSRLPDATGSVTPHPREERHNNLGYSSALGSFNPHARAGRDTTFIL